MRLVNPSREHENRINAPSVHRKIRDGGDQSHIVPRIWQMAIFAIETWGEWALCLPVAYDRETKRQPRDTAATTAFTQRTLRSSSEKTSPELRARLRAFAARIKSPAHFGAGTSIGGWIIGTEPHRGNRLEPIRNSSMARAHWRPSRIAQTTSDCPRRISPAVNILGTEVW